MPDIEVDSKAGAHDGQAKQVPFDNISNFRDVGKMINGLLGEK